MSYRKGFFMSDKNRNSNQSVEKKIVIAERDTIAAVLENKKVTDFFIHRGEVLLGDVYLATGGPGVLHGFCMYLAGVLPAVVQEFSTP